MYRLAEYEVSRQRRAEIRQEVAAYRLESALRANSGKGSGLLGDLKWELSRYAGLLGKRIRNRK